MSDEWYTILRGLSRDKAFFGRELRPGSTSRSAFMKDSERPRLCGTSPGWASSSGSPRDRGMYLDVTGLGCYHKQDVPRWYIDLGRSAPMGRLRPAFWKAVAGLQGPAPADLCYDLHELADPHRRRGAGRLAPRPTPGGNIRPANHEGSKGRTDNEVAGPGSAKHLPARDPFRVDDRPIITVVRDPLGPGFKGAKPLFFARVLRSSSTSSACTSTPKGGNTLYDDLTAPPVYEVGKPLVIEEIFHLGQLRGDRGLPIPNESLGTRDAGFSFLYWQNRFEDREERPT